MKKLFQTIKKKIYRKKISYIRNLYRNKLLREKNVYIDKTSSGYHNVFFEGDNGVPERCQFLGDKIKIGYRTTLGRNNLLSGSVKIGKYCQIGADVAMHASNHPISYMTTYINKKLFDGDLKKYKLEHEIVIGNDVWIGHGVIIVGQVTIGDGAILAAGSVVTKNVKPYSVVGGIPAKEIKKRFSPSIINEIESLQWWDKADGELNKLRSLFEKDFSGKKSIYE